MNALHILNSIAQLNFRHRGIVRAVTLEYERQTGEKVKRQQIGQWLDPAPDQRTEPLLATGIALAKACKVVLKRHDEKPFPKRKAAR